MPGLIELLWQRCKGTWVGRLLAGVVIGGLFGAAVASQFRDLGLMMAAAGGTALIGALAVLVLELNDRQRAARRGPAEPEAGPALPTAPPETRVPSGRAAGSRGAQQDEAPSGPIAWAGMIFGLGLLLLGLLAAARRVIAFLGW